MAWQYTPIESGWLVGYNVTVLDYQHIEDDLHVWGGDVNAGGHGLTNLDHIIGTGGLQKVINGNFDVMYPNISKSNNTQCGVVTSTSPSIDGANTLQGYFQLNASATSASRRLSIFAIENGVSARSLTLNEFGVGNVGIWTNNPLNTLHVHLGTNQNLGFRSNGISQVEIGTFNDADTVSVPLSFSATAFAFVGLPSTNPGAGSHQLWYDPSDSNRVKYAA